MALNRVNFIPECVLCDTSVSVFSVNFVVFIVLVTHSFWINFARCRRVYRQGSARIKHNFQRPESVKFCRQRV